MGSVSPVPSVPLGHRDPGQQRSAPSTPEPLLPLLLSQNSGTRQRLRAPGSGCRCGFAVPVLEKLNQRQQLGAIKGNLQFPGQCKHLQPAITGSSPSRPWRAGLLVLDADFSDPVQISLNLQPQTEGSLSQDASGGGLVQTPLWHRLCLSDGHLVTPRTSLHS